MANYLRRLLERSYERTDVLRPRPPYRFESSAESVDLAAATDDNSAEASTISGERPITTATPAAPPVNDAAPPTPANISFDAPGQTINASDPVTSWKQPSQSSWPRPDSDGHEPALSQPSANSPIHDAGPPAEPAHQRQTVEPGDFERPTANTARESGLNAEQPFRSPASPPEQVPPIDFTAESTPMDALTHGAAGDSHPADPRQPTAERSTAPTRSDRPRRPPAPPADSRIEPDSARPTEPPDQPGSAALIPKTDSFDAHHDTTFESYSADEPPARRSTADRGETASPTVKVSIGRIEVRAAQPPPKSPPSARRAAPRPLMSLTDYLKKRDGRES